MSRPVIGLGGWDHDASAAILQNNTVLAIGEEERFTRVKYQGQRHLASVNFCLGRAPSASNPAFAYSFAEPQIVDQLCLAMETAFPGFRSLLTPVDHHLSHSTAAFWLSGYQKALVLTVDGYGDGVSTAAWDMSHSGARQIWKVPHPHSLGSLWMGINFLLGFGMRDAGKVMGLAPYGQPRYADVLLEAITLNPDGTYAFQIEKHGTRPFLHSGASLFQRVMGPPRDPKTPLTQIHMDVAASLQAATETIVMHALERLKLQTGHTHLCLSGGVALNSVLNGRILRSKLFDHVFVPPNPGDNGTGIGCALHLTGQLVGPSQLNHAYFGNEYTAEQIHASLTRAGVDFTRHENIEQIVAQHLLAGHVVGWFQGRAEIGPRALGNRSILADPRVHDMKDIVNSRVKHREWFRPFAPVVIQSKASQWFDLPHPSPFMLFVAPVLEDRRSQLPAITHVDGSARVQTVSETQNPRMHRLLTQFEALTGVPVLLNTSFNVMGEPIVHSPDDAIRCFLGTNLHSVAIGDFLVTKKTL